MAVPAFGQDVKSVYSDYKKVFPRLPSGWLFGAPTAGGGPSTDPNKVSYDDLTQILLDLSRDLDGTLRSAGFMVPFPAFGATNPETPRIIERIVRNRAIAEVYDTCKPGNRKANLSSFYEDRGDALEEKLLLKPTEIGYGQVNVPENFRPQVGSPPNYPEAGFMTGVWYRLKNRNVLGSTLRFVNSDGSEALRSDHIGFDQKRDWDIMKASEGIIAIYNTEILTAIDRVGGPNSGGVVYEFSWVDFARHEFKPSAFRGVSRK